MVFGNIGHLCDDKDASRITLRANLRDSCINSYSACRVAKKGNGACVRNPLVRSIIPRKEELADDGSTVVGCPPKLCTRYNITEHRKPQPPPGRRSKWKRTAFSFSRGTAVFASCRDTSETHSSDKGGFVEMPVKHTVVKCRPSLLARRL